MANQDWHERRLREVGNGLGWQETPETGNSEPAAGEEEAVGRHGGSLKDIKTKRTGGVGSLKRCEEGTNETMNRKEVKDMQ